MRRLDELLEQGDANAVALIDRKRQLTYAELRTAVASVASGLAEQVRPGDRVAVWLPKSLEAVIALFAAARMGAIAVPVNQVLRGQQADHILRDCEASLLITNRPRAASLPEQPCPVLLVEEGWEELTDHAPHPGIDCDPQSLAMLFYTSGSTGRPKGVMVTHANLLIGAEAVRSYLGTGTDDRILSVLPLSFDFGLSQLTTAFLAGATIVLLDYLAPRDVLQAVVQQQITTLAAVPPLWMQIMGLDWPAEARAQLRTLSNSGGRLPVPVVEALRKTFPQARLHLMYGLTEAFRSTTLPPELVDSHPASIGRAIPHAEILVVRTDGSPCGPGEAGELVHCGPLVTKGYWRDEQKTAERFRPAPPSSQMGGTAVWSGDTVIADADGLLTFVGRADETIKTMGTRLSPTEVEELAYQSGAVSHVVALGIADEAAGQLVRLVAEATAGLRVEDAERQLRSWLKREGAPFMQPASIIWLEAMPVSPNGKLDRAAIRQRFGQ